MIRRISTLQRCVLLRLLAESETPSEKNQRELNADIYSDFFGCEENPDRLPSAKASLSRAYKRLEMHGLIKRKYGKWYLTDTNDGLDNGWIIAMDIFLSLATGEKS
jgi:hypothetical protein